jgi:diguanylate cyclase (GGDEF)-like protein/PAS domain S-box-containing protein
MKPPLHPVYPQPAEPLSLAEARVPVLVVDDNAGKRFALKSILVPLGFVVVEADSGFTALRLLLGQDFAVILMDVKMPIMDGFETTQLIRQRRQSELTPIIFITAYPDEVMANITTYPAGAADFIVSPVPPAELRAKVTVFANLYLRAEILAAQARAVQELADQLTLLTDAAPIGIFRTDADNNYSYTNPRWSEITGVSFADAAGRPWDDIMTRAEACEPPAAADGQAVERPFARAFEIIRRSDSVSRTVEGTVNPLTDGDDAIVGWVGILADVTADEAAKAAMLISRDAALAASETDPLTGLSNRRRLEHDLVIECDRAMRYHRPLSFIMLDADNFKDFNDANGHQAGDEVLRDLAAIFAETLRASDTAYRYGGEEFCLLLRETAAAEAMLVAERIRVRLEQHHSGEAGAVTASFGVATFAAHGQEPEAFVEAADKALYAAKRAGRNCVVLSTTEQRRDLGRLVTLERKPPLVVPSAS